MAHFALCMVLFSLDRINALPFLHNGVFYLFPPFSVKGATLKTEESKLHSAGPREIYKQERNTVFISMFSLV